MRLSLPSLGEPALDLLAVDRPEIYYGELTTEPVVVNTTEPEFDYPSGETNVYTHYEGSGGVVMSSFWRKFLFGWKFDGTVFLHLVDLSPLGKFEASPVSSVRGSAEVSIKLGGKRLIPATVVDDELVEWDRNWIQYNPPPTVELWRIYVDADDTDAGDDGEPVGLQEVTDGDLVDESTDEPAEGRRGHRKSEVAAEALGMTTDELREGGAFRFFRADTQQASHGDVNPGS